MSLRSIRLFQPAKLTALAIVILCGLSVASAQADYIVTLQQVGPDVVATGSGTLDLTGLNLTSVVGGSVGDIDPTDAAMVVGLGPIDDYEGFFSGPFAFGPGFSTQADSSSGAPVGVVTNSDLFVPTGYVSGTPLSLGSSTWNAQTFSSLGVTPGIYTWSWGAGPNQKFTLIAGVPDSGSTFGLLFLAVATLFGVSRFRSLRVA